MPINTLLVPLRAFHPLPSSSLFMEPHGQGPWYLHKIPSYAKASEGYPPSAKSAEAAKLQLMINPGTVYAFIHGQSPYSSA
jgi:hypothetical protein